MKLALRSDFLDYYDHALDREPDHPHGRPWERMARSWATRREDVEDLVLAELEVPPHGLAAAFDEGAEVVVYDDPQAHRGEGKRRVRACEVPPETFAVSFVASTLPPRSFRLLAVGRKIFWLRYTSTDEWRSNVGDVSIELMHSSAWALNRRFVEGALRCQRRRSTPLVAIDFVEAAGLLFAVDLNTAPGIRQSPVEPLMSAAEVASHLRARWEEIYTP